MSSELKISYLDIKNLLLERIRSKEWLPDSPLPSEIALAEEFGCARATVSRALNELADEGIVSRKRRAGTTLIASPEKSFRYQVTTTRAQVESRGFLYGLKQIRRQYFVEPPRDLLEYTGLDPDHEVFFVMCLHIADDRPYLLEERWFDATLLPAAVDLDYQKTAADDWLAREYPFRSAHYELWATGAEEEASELLQISKNTPVLRIRQRVLSGDNLVSVARLTNQHDHILKAGY